MTVCFDRGGWSPALFADILDAGLGLLPTAKARRRTCPPRRSPPSPAPTTAARLTSPKLADTTVALDITEGPLKSQQVTLRQVTRRGKHQQVHILTPPAWPARRGGVPTDEL